MLVEVLRTMSADVLVEAALQVTSARRAFDADGRLVDPERQRRQRAGDEGQLFDVGPIRQELGVDVPAAQRVQPVGRSGCQTIAARERTPRSGAWRPRRSPSAVGPLS